MDDKNLSIFENRSDDWLAKERAYEETVSAWDFDEGRRIKEAHEKRHDAYNKTHERGLIADLPKINSVNNQFSDLTKFKPTNSKGAVIVGVMMLVMGFAFLILIGSFSGVIEVEEISFAFPIIVFIIISVLAGKKGGKKK